MLLCQSTDSNQLTKLIKPTSFDDLPDAMLIKIFRQLPILQRNQIDKIKKDWERLISKCTPCLVVGQAPAIVDVLFEDKIIEFLESKNEFENILCSFLKKNGHSLLKIYLDFSFF